MNIKEVERLVGKVQTSLFKKSNAYSIGLLKSSFRGSGLQFKEHQVYNPGDDVRFIDWKLSAKSQKAYIKTFEEERNVEIVILMDYSTEMLLGYNEVSKGQAAFEMIYLMYLLTAQTSDRVTLNLFYDQLYKLPPLSGRSGIAQMIDLLVKCQILSEEGVINRYDVNEWKRDEALQIKTLKQLLAKRKEVIYITSKQNFSDEFSVFLKHKNFHIFSVLSPLDYANKQPFTLWGRENSNSGFSFKRNLHSDDLVLDKKIKMIDVSKSYLDQFIRYLK